MESSRLKPLLDAAQKKEDAFTARLLEKRRTLQQAERKLGELKAYLEDYCRHQDRTITPAMLRSRRDFVDRLRSAVAMQEGVVRLARDACEQERGRWLGAHRSTEIFDKLTEQSLREERRHADRREARDSDEVAAQRWLAQKAR